MMIIIHRKAFHYLLVIFKMRFTKQSFTGNKVTYFAMKILVVVSYPHSPTNMLKGIANWSAW